MSLHISQLRNWLVQSPPVEWAISILRDLLIGALRQGPIPRHIAFVMDGNRRFAKRSRIETVEGHNLGFEALARILEVCYKAGVQVVTIYAFSIENFKRSKYEVDALMDMAKVKLSQLAQHGDLLDRYGASVRVLGQTDLVKDDVLKAINAAVDVTSHNTRAVLNICFPYTSRDEMTTAIRSTVAEYSQPLQPRSRPSLKRPFSESRITHNIRSQKLETLKEESNSPDTSRSPSRTRDSEQETGTSSPADVETDSNSNSSSATLTNHPSSPHSPPSSRAIYRDPETITSETITAHTFFGSSSPPLDILIRTSGVERLSDFMLWQAHEYTSIVFLSCLWPEFSLWQFLPVLVEWQWWRRKRLTYEEAYGAYRSGDMGIGAGVGAGVGAGAGTGARVVDDEGAARRRMNGGANKASPSDGAATGAPADVEVHKDNNDDNYTATRRQKVL